jgi:hypothetical protein
VDVSWQPPSGGAPVASYLVSVSPSGGTQSPMTATSVHVTGLSCSTTYSFTVYSVGAGGQKVAAAPASALPCLAPSAPQRLSTQVSQHQVQLSWSAPAAPGGGTMSYTVNWGNGPKSATGTSYTITGLTNFQTYNVTVTASSQAGPGSSASKSVSVLPPATWGYSITRDWKYGVYVRSQPNAGSSSVSSFPAGAAGQPVQVTCQVWGGGYTDPTGSPNFPNGAVWDKLASGGYVADGYVTTPNSLANTFSAPIWQCQ